MHLIKPKNLYSHDSMYIMCPTEDKVELTPEEKAVLEDLDQKVEELPSEEEEVVSEDQVVEEDSKDLESEGVDEVEDIPKGKENNYGI